MGCQHKNNLHCVLFVNIQIGRQEQRSITLSKMSLEAMLNYNERRSESANLRQHCAKFFHCVRCKGLAHLSMVNSFNPILDADADPDHHQNLTTYKLNQV